MVRPGAAVVVRRRTVVLTRAVEDNRALRDLLQQAGIEVVELPTAQFADVALDRAVAEHAASAAAVTFASPHAVTAFLRQVGASALQHRAGLLAVVGQATAAALQPWDLQPDLIAESPSTGHALAQRLVARLQPASTVIAVQARHSQPDLVAALQAAGHHVHAAVAYENVEPSTPSAADLARAASADAIYLAAPSAADRLLAWSPELGQRALATIGPTTAAALRERHHIEPAAIAASPALTDVAAALFALCT